MGAQSIKTSLRLFTAKCLIRFRRLTYVDYTVAEISELIAPHLPVTLPISVPRGDGQVSLTKINISMPFDADYIQAEVLGNIHISYLANPIYRAHVVLVVQAKPEYDNQSKSVRLVDIKVTDIHMLNDEYSILKDTSNLLNLLVPSPVASIVSGTMKTAFNLMTGTTTSEATHYLEVYLSGSKQKVLDYHKPQIEKIIVDLAAAEDMQYSLDKHDFEEGLFMQYGKKVVVEQGNVRFKF
ncbi:hypothetical protein [uncultured Paraglaciecola sp.]|uniref:hypothetical protein n=1 Tax=uncultured Paraglaciecola sp. TaxID=1765024 RepID=UPI00261B8444|nr:hypothetical protein [uncultured Paraglaciecola sp.]